MDASNSEFSLSPSGSQAEDLQQLVQEVLRKFRLVAASIKGQVRQIPQNCNISQTQLWAIHLIAQAPGMSVKDLAREMSVKSTTASNLLDKLDRAGYVSRQRNDRDQRIVRLYLTESAQVLLAEIPGNPIGALPEALARLPQQQLQCLDAHLAELMTVLQTELQA